MDRSDIAAISPLLERARDAEAHLPLNEEQWTALVRAGSASNGFVAVIASDEPHGQVAGYAQASRDGADWTMAMVADPRSKDRGLRRELVSAVIAEVRALGGGKVRLWVPKPTPAHDSIAAAAGLRPERDLLAMTTALPLGGEAPAATVRPFRPGQDEEEWVRVNNRAFAGHPEQGAWQVATLRMKEQEPWFDPSGFLLHEEQGRLAAFCWTKIHTDQDPVLGEIYVIGVDPDFQGRGLGRDMTVAGLDSIASRGVTTGSLYVDSANEAAVHMYEGLGFRIDHLDRAYAGYIEPSH